MTKFYTEMMEDSLLVLGIITENDERVAVGLYPAHLMTSALLSQQKRKILNETSAGNSFGRMPIIGELDRAFTEKMPWNGQLHPEFWDNDTQRLWGAMAATMKSMANDFIRKVQIPTDWIEDIIFKGSLATYNYTPTSDIDVQIILKYDWDKNPAKDPKDKHGTMIEREFSNRRAEYNKNSGFHLAKEQYPVEFFIQTPKTNVKTGASARWSLMKNDWLPGYKPNPSAPGVPPKEINAYFKDYYDRVKNAYFTRLKLTNLEAALAAKKELGYISGNDRNTALHGTEEQPAHLTADIDSPANLAFKALKRTKLIAFIETEIAKARQKGLMDLKQQLDQKGRPMKKLNEDPYEDDEEFEEDDYPYEEDEYPDESINEGLGVGKLMSARRNSLRRREGNASYSAASSRNAANIATNAANVMPKKYEKGYRRSAREHAKYAEMDDKHAQNLSRARARNKQFSDKLPNWLKEEIETNEGLVQGALRLRRDRLSDLAVKRKMKARRLEKESDRYDAEREKHVGRSNQRAFATRANLKYHQPLKAIGHAVIGVEHEKLIKKYDRAAQKAAKKSSKEYGKYYDADRARERNQKLANKLPQWLEEEARTPVSVYVDYISFSKKI